MPVLNPTRACIRLRIALLVLLAAACDGSNNQTQPPPSSASSTLPGITEVPLTIQEADLPDLDPITVAVTSTGHFGYVLPRVERDFVVIVDSTGRVSSRWGRRGEGPGEVRRGYLLAGDSFFVFVGSDPATVLVFDAQGTLINQRAGSFHEGFPGAVVGWQVDRSLGQRIVGLRGVSTDVPGPIVRDCLLDSCEHELLPASDSFLREAHVATPRREGLRWPPYAAEPGRFVIGDGVNYRLWYFDESGRVIGSLHRDIPRRIQTNRERSMDESTWARLIQDGIAVDVPARRALAKVEPLPHFGFASMGFDADHRLWVVGKSQDSTFLDVFADTVFIGRHMVDCIPPARHPVGIRGRFIVVTCAHDDDIEAPIRFRMFRIEND